MRLRSLGTRGRRTGKAWSSASHPTLSETGAVTTQAFDSWFAGVQKDHAFVLKQQRLLQEEREAEAKKQKGHNKKKGEQEE